MNVLLLGGQSPRHYDWVREFQTALQAHGHTVFIHDYTHWLSGGNDINLEVEIAAVAELAKDLQDYVIVAKSIGTVITTLGVARGLLIPKACVFLGFPLQVVQATYDTQVAEALAALPPTTCVHNEHDPLGSAVAMQAYISAYKPSEVRYITTPGDTHDYTDFERINELIVAE